jgi:hypothetical protein
MSVLGATARDSQGYLMTPSAPFRSPTYAISTGRMEVASDVTSTDIPHRLLGDAKVTVRSNSTRSVFVGVAPSSRVARYLQGVRRATVVDFGRGGFYFGANDVPRPVYRVSAGTAPRTPPADSPIWLAQRSGTGTQSITWPVTKGTWTVVVMNADGSAGINTDVAIGATVPAFGWVLAALWGGVVVCLVLGAVLLVVAIAGATRRS